MENQELNHFLEYVGKDPSRLIFEDEATGIYNRRYLHHYLQYKIPNNSQEDRSLSLIMLDVDHFKEINDTYGHQIGDEALIWVARVLKKVAGEDCIPIRYAGDEFMILLPEQKKDFALRMGERLLQWVRSEPFRHKTMDSSVNITFSIGVASVPMNKKGGKELIHKADTALYYAKQKGRDCLADADSLDNEVVFSKTAINKLEDIKIVGRKKQLEQVAECLKKFAQPQNQFLIIEGAAGMGKSAFLDVVHRTLDQSKIYTIKTKGIPHEMFHPYYSIIDILMSILNQREDKGTGIFKTLSEEEISYLSNFLPPLGEKKWSSAKKNKNKKLQREDIFNTLIRLLFKIINNRPFAILVDDLHYLDEATLLLFRQMKLECKSPLFICGTSPETADLQDYNEIASLELFYKNYSKELDIKKITLTPLTAVDIGNHIKGIFSNVHLSENIIKELMQITQGNPLFLSEILRKLVQDQKIVLVGHEWLVLPCDEGYLPKSLEEIVSQKIAALDEENRQLLEQISAFGTNVPLSALTGSSGKIETQVLEFIDKAKNQGLISSEFKLNDETINFLSRSILQIAYGSIGDKRKQEVHEKIGNYQEALYKKNLLPSVATLAYHFKRSSDQTRTQKYEKLIADWNSKIFNAKEAEEYKIKEETMTTDESLGEKTFLDSASLEKVPKIIRYLLNALRILKLYPKGSQSTINSIKQLKEEIDQILENTNFINIVHISKTLLVNDQVIDIDEFESVAHNFFTFLNQFDLKSIGFYKGVTENELEVLLDGLCSIKADIVDPEFWQRFLNEHPDITNINLRQVRYTKKGEPDDHELKLRPFDQRDSVISGGPSFQLFSLEQDLVQEDLAHILEIIRALLRTSRNIKLYPLESKAISDSIEDLMQALQNILAKYPVLSLAHVSGSLLVNGKKIDVTVFGTVGKSFLKFLETTRIKSLSFLQCITSQELQTFIGSLGHLPDEPSDNNFWENLSEDKEFSGILFNKQLYEILEGIRGNDSNGRSEEDISEEGEDEDTTDDSLDAFLEEIKERLSDLFINENQKKLEKTVKELFKGFHDRDSSSRKKVIDCCQRMLEELNLAGKCRFSELMADHLLNIFSEEKDLDISSKIALLLNQIVNCFIQFAEYQSASKILFHLQKNQFQYNKKNNEHTQMQSKGINIELDTSTHRLLMDDLKSTDSSRQKDTIQLLEMLGEAAIPMLIDVIKQEDDFRIRKIASALLEEMSPGVGKMLKQEFLKEIETEERIRILEILDNFSTDLREDLVFFLTDRNPRVRKAAFQLAERIDEKYVIEVLMDFAENEETSLATAAIKSLGRFKIPTVGQKILSLLNSTKEEERLIAICRALGQIGDPSSIDPLAKILAPKHFFGFHRKPSIQVRTAAAYALSQIPHKRGTEVLRLYVGDPNPGIKHIAKSALEKVKS
ncbi:MAG: diguanylate cyclase [bacterium]